jgi:hypothetical protein
MNNTEREILYKFRKDIYSYSKWHHNLNDLNTFTYDHYKFIIQNSTIYGLTSFEIYNLIVESWI